MKLREFSGHYAELLVKSGRNIVSGDDIERARYDADLISDVRKAFEALTKYRGFKLSVGTKSTLEKNLFEVVEVEGKSCAALKTLFFTHLLELYPIIADATRRSSQPQTSSNNRYRGSALPSMDFARRPHPDDMRFHEADETFAPDDYHW